MEGFWGEMVNIITLHEILNKIFKSNKVLLKWQCIHDMILRETGKAEGTHLELHLHAICTCYERFSFLNCQGKFHVHVGVLLT